MSFSSCVETTDVQSSSPGQEEERKDEGSASEKNRSAEAAEEVDEKMPAETVAKSIEEDVPDEALIAQQHQQKRHKKISERSMEMNGRGSSDEEISGVAGALKNMGEKKEEKLRKKEASIEKKLENQPETIEKRVDSNSNLKSSRSPTPNKQRPSASVSPNDPYQNYNFHQPQQQQQNFGTPFSGGVGVVQPPPPNFLSTRGYPFPYFANPFMAPFVPHLPQQLQQPQQQQFVNQHHQNFQSHPSENGEENSGQNATCSTSAMQPQDLYGIRSNPLTGGLFVHPHYYQEIIQQYLMNAGLVGQMENTNEEEKEEESERKSADENRAEETNFMAQRNSETKYEENGESASTGEAAGSRDAVGRRLAARTNDATASDWRDTGNRMSDFDGKANGSAGSSAADSVEGSATSSADVSPLKVSRAGLPHLEDGLSSEQPSDSEFDQADRQNARATTDPENPAMLLIKKQISEIEKQILRKAQNQNIRKMDAKEIETFLMEQHRTLEANFFENSTNTGAWAAAAFPWRQDEGVDWERQAAGAVADAIARQQFEATADRRSLYELAAAAASVSPSASVDAHVSGPSRPAGFVQAHFPQNVSPMINAAAMYPPGSAWAAPFYPSAASSGYAGPSTGGFLPAAGHMPVYGPMGAFPHPYLSNPQAYAAAAAAVSPNNLPPGFMYANAPPPPPLHLQQQQMQQQQMDQEIAIRHALHLQRANFLGNSTLKGGDASVSLSSSSSSSVVATPLANIENTKLNHQSRNASAADAWHESNDEQQHWAAERHDDDNAQDEPVWVLRESYVRKIKREEERLAQRERNEEKKLHKENLAAADKAAAVDSDVDTETDKLLGAPRVEPQHHGVEEEDEHSVNDLNQQQQLKKTKKKKEVMVHEPAVLIEGVLFRARYLGSTQLVCDGRPTKATRMMQAQEAVSRIKAPDGEPQPSTDVDLFISTEKIMVLNTDLQRISETDVRQDIMMDHPLRTISYIADIGDLVVLMARRVSQASPDSPEPAIRRTPRVICHIFESDEAQFIAQSIGQAFQVAYMEFLRANGIDDPGYLRDVDYQEVLNAQEIFGEELEMFARKETQKDVVVPKQKNENFGVVIVESGWGSMIPTVVIANLMPGGPAARSNNLNIGDHIIALNGISFVGLPLSACQNHIRNVKHLTAVKLTVVHTPPVVEVRIKRPDTKYQLGFSVQNGVICSLLRGGIAERGGVRVGHRIIEINSQSVVAVPHEKIVTMLATAVGEIQMKTMPTSMFRLLTGQETPNYI